MSVRAAWPVFLTTLAIFPLLAGRVYADAGDVETYHRGPYLRLELGAGTGNDPAGSDGFTTELWPGLATGAALGYSFGSIRLEGEFYYQLNLVEDQTMGNVSRAESFVSPFLVQIDGELQTIAFMANAYYEFRRGEKFRPFLGAGIGAANVRAKYQASEVFLFASSPHTSIVDDADTVLAYQGSAGFAVETGGGTDLILMYRYFATGDPRFTDFTGSTLTQEGVATHSGLIGVRYRF